MKKLVAFLALGVALCAQAREWTLQECVDYAVEHNLTVMSRQNQLEQSQNELTAAKDALLPTVSGQASQTWNFGRGLTASNTYADRNTDNLSLSAGMNLPLFQGLQNVRTIALQRTNLAAALENLEAAKDDVTLQVIALYLQALYSREMVKVAESQANLTAEELLRRQALMESGRIPEADMLDAKSQDAQARMQLVTAENDLRLALLDLAQQLRLENPSEFDIAELPEEESPMLQNPQEVYAAALRVNHTIAADSLNVEAAGRQIKVAQTGWIPRLNFNAGLGTNYYKVHGYDNDPFSAQMRHNFAQYVGFGLNIPIFDGFQTRNAVRRARTNQISQIIAQETNRDNLYKSIQQCYYQAVGAREKLTAATTAVTASEAALKAVQEKYALGRATPVDFDTAKNQYIKSQSDRVQARYELLLRTRILNFYAGR